MLTIIYQTAFTTSEGYFHINKKMFSTSNIINTKLLENRRF